MSEQKPVIRKGATFNGKTYYYGPKDNRQPSINQAKKASREYQLANGGLGCGSVVVHK